MHERVLFWKDKRVIKFLSKINNNSFIYVVAPVHKKKQFGSCFVSYQAYTLINVATLNLEELVAISSF